MEVDMDEVLYNEAIEEIGTVVTEGLTDLDVDSWTNSSSAGLAMVFETEDLAGVADELLEVHGVAPGKKSKGVTRLIYWNVDGINNRIGENEKLEKAKGLIDELEVNIAALNEHKMRLGHKLNRNGLSQMFNGGETKIRSVIGSNVHERGGQSTARRHWTLVVWQSDRSIQL